MKILKLLFAATPESHQYAFVDPLFRQAMVMRSWAEGIDTFEPLFKKPTTTVLLVCKRLHEEYAEVLYSQTTFAFDRGQTAKTFILGGFGYPGIGMRNAGRIKKADFLIPDSDGKNIDRFVCFVVKGFPGLVRLRLTARLDSRGNCSERASRWLTKRTTMLRSAAGITASHPKLKKAVWTNTDVSCAHGTSQRKKWWSKDDDPDECCAVEFYINLWVAGRKPRVGTKYAVKPNQRGLETAGVRRI